jgi:hypothetical protein
MKCIEVINGNFNRVNGRTQVLTGDKALKQRIEHSLKLFRNEWFLSNSKQVNWLKYFRQKYITELFLKKEIKDVILQDSEVKSVESIELSLVSDIRQLQVKCKVQSTYGFIGVTV